MSQGVQGMKAVRPWHERGGAFTSACLAQNGALVILVLLRIWPLHVIVPAPHFHPFINSSPQVKARCMHGSHGKLSCRVEASSARENSHQTLHVTSSRDRRLHIIGIYAVGDFALCVVICRTLQHQIDNIEWGRFYKLPYIRTIGLMQSLTVPSHGDMASQTRRQAKSFLLYRYASVKHRFKGQ